jgi:hypothetical protein
MWHPSPLWRHIIGRELKHGASIALMETHYWARTENGASIGLTGPIECGNIYSSSIEYFTVDKIIPNKKATQKALDLLSQPLFFVLIGCKCIRNHNCDDFSFCTQCLPSIHFSFNPIFFWMDFMYGSYGF